MCLVGVRLLGVLSQPSSLRLAGGGGGAETPSTNYLSKTAPTP